MKKAFTLIELIISIVIIGIVLAAFPMVLTQTQNNNAFAIQQEAIFQAKSQMGIVSRTPWDKNSYDVTNPDNPLKALLTDASTAADSELGAIVPTGLRRVGHVNLTNRRGLYDITNPDANVTGTPSLTNIPSNMVPSSIPATGNLATSDYYGMEEFNGYSQTFEVSSSATVGTGDFLIPLTLNVGINYVSDAANYNNNDITNFNFLIAPAAGVTNIKMITVRASSTGNPDVVLRAYASNVGQSGDGLIRRSGW